MKKLASYFFILIIFIFQWKTSVVENVNSKLFSTHTQLEYSICNTEKGKCCSQENSKNNKCKNECKDSHCHNISTLSNVFISNDVQKIWVKNIYPFHKEKWNYTPFKLQSVFLSQWQPPKIIVNS